ncbi:MAG: MoaD/ThiS family protein, partial [Desulfonatronovibrionaceae bacterium]
EHTPREGSMEAAPGATPLEVLKKLGIPEDEVRIVFVNGRNSPRDVPLQENDRVGIFPAIGGG